LDRGKRYLPDLRELLNQDIPAAAEAIRTMTGPITVRQEKVPGKTGARWIATFQPDVLALLRQVARDKGRVEARGLAVAPLDRQEVEVVIEKIHAYEKLAPKFRQMHKSGASVQDIARAHGMTWQDADRILDFAITGKRPKWKKGNRTGTGAKPAKYPKIQKKVAHLRDKRKMSFPKIAEKLGVAESTVRRAYDAEHRADIRKAVEQRSMPKIGT
jgi:hypothetical protein